MEKGIYQGYIIERGVNKYVAIKSSSRFSCCPDSCDLKEDFKKPHSFMVSECEPRNGCGCGKFIFKRIDKRSDLYKNKQELI